MKIYDNIKDNKEIFLLFGGFASHPSHFEDFFGEKNFVLVYDYTSLDFDEIFLKLNTLLEDKKEIILLAFSMGVWVANKFLILNKNLSFKISKIISINGTSYGINNSFGIPYKIFSFTAKNFQLSSFKKSLFGNSLKKAKNFQFAEEDLLKKELENLLENYSLECEVYAFWDSAIVSKNDLIFPPKAQISFWENYANQITKNPNFKISFLEASHFTFFDRKLLCEIF